LSGTIVLKIPYESKSFHAARAALQEPLPVETYEARQEILSRIQEWTGVTIALEDAAYIPLRTDWMPPRDRRTADGVEILLAASGRMMCKRRSRPGGSRGFRGGSWQSFGRRFKHLLLRKRIVCKSSESISKSRSKWQCLKRSQRIGSNGSPTTRNPHEPGPWETPQGYRMIWDATAQKIVFEHRYVYEKHHGGDPLRVCYPSYQRDQE